MLSVEAGWTTIHCDSGKNTINALGSWHLTRSPKQRNGSGHDRSGCACPGEAEGKERWNWKARRGEDIDTGSAVKGRTL